MKRVNKANPCPACGKDSWCLYDENSVLCMRNSAGRLHLLKSGEQGWWHDLKEKPKEWRPPVRQPEPPKIDADAIMIRLRTGTKLAWLDQYADELGVTSKSISDLGAAWSPSHRAWAWPMSDEFEKTIGIRLRYEDGSKKAVLGSKSGLFVPNWVGTGMLFLPEGPTDTAALLSIGVSAVGRPSCSGGAAQLKAFIHRKKIRQCVIVADNDCDRENRRQNLQSWIRRCHRPSEYASGSILHRYITVQRCA